MNFFKSIAFRISISIAVIIAATATAVGWLILSDEKKTLELELRSKGSYLAELISRQITEPLLYEERYEIFSLLQASMKGEESLVVYAEVYDKDGEKVVSTYKDGISPEKLPSILIPGATNIKEDGEAQLYHIGIPISVENLGTIGYLKLGITKKHLYIILQNIKKKIFLISASIRFIGTMMGLWMAIKILRHILSLNKGAKKIGDGEVGVEVPIVGVGEIKELALSFNRMSIKLKELIDAIQAAQENLVRTEKL